MDAVLGGDNGDSIILTAESELAMFDRSANYLYTNAQQQSDSSGDTFFTHLQEMEDLTLDWGKRKAGSGSGIKIIEEDENEFDQVTF